MEENKGMTENTEEKVAETPEERKKKAEEAKKLLETRTAEMKEKAKEARMAMMEGKGRLALEKPIVAGDEEIKELVYDFTALTGMEYTEALDSDQNAGNQFYGSSITNRQALYLFAKAASKQTEKVDTRDIMERIGITDASAAVQLAVIFFAASTRAGKLRITRM